MDLFPIDKRAGDGGSPAIGIHEHGAREHAARDKVGPLGPSRVEPREATALVPMSVQQT